MFTVDFNKSTWNNFTNRLKNIEYDLKKMVASDLEKVAIETAQTARAKAHVITGNMRASIDYRKYAELGYEVYASIEYAPYENARGPPHDFFDQAVRSAKTRGIQVLQSGVTAIVAKK